MQAKPWQIAVIALAFVAVGGSTAYLVTRSGTKVPTRANLVDVTTGQIYEWDKARYRTVLPAPSPEAPSEFRLVPVTKDASGKWLLTDNGRNMLKAITAKPTAIDTSTGEVISSAGGIKSYVPPTN